MPFDGYEGGLIPDVDLVPLIHAAWVNTEPGLNEFKRSNMCMACSNCKHRAGKYKYKTYRYCPWCGAKMDIPVAKVDVQDDFAKTITFVGKIVRNKNG
jgi:hypothetical protein